MIPEILKENERQLRKAIARRHYGDVPQRLEDMRRIADAHRQPEVAAWMLATLRWARFMVTAQRQTWADQLELLPLVNRYLDRAPVPLPDVCLDL